jgi:hypothetical protein
VLDHGGLLGGLSGPGAGRLLVKERARRLDADTGPGKIGAWLAAPIGAADAFPGPGSLPPTRNTDLFRWRLGKGLKVVQPLTLMGRGLYSAPNGAFPPSILY